MCDLNGLDYSEELDYEYSDSGDDSDVSKFDGPDSTDESYKVQTKLNRTKYLTILDKVQTSTKFQRKWRRKRNNYIKLWRICSNDFIFQFYYSKFAKQNRIKQVNQKPTSQRFQQTQGLGLDSKESAKFNSNFSVKQPFSHFPRRHHNMAHNNEKYIQNKQHINLETPENDVNMTQMEQEVKQIMDLSITVNNDLCTKTSQQTKT